MADMVYICSPYRADNLDDLSRNIIYAQELTRKALLKGLYPVTPHLYMTQCLKDHDAVERAAGCKAGLGILRRCSAVVVGTRYGISEGMKAEIAAARKLYMPVIYLDREQKQPKTKEENKESED